MKSSRKPRDLTPLLRTSGGILNPAGNVVEHERLAAFNLAAERCGTIFEPASFGFALRIGGAITCDAPRRAESAESHTASAPHGSTA